MSAAFSNAEVVDDGDFVVNEAPSVWHTALLVIGALALAGLLVWTLKKGGG